MKNNSVLGVIIGVILVVGVVLVLVVAWFNTDKPAQQQPSNTTVTAKSLIGQPLPPISLTDRAGKVYDLAGLTGKNVVLFFSEGLQCYPACWNQMASFGTDGRFNSADTLAISVVADSPQDWQRATAKMPTLAQATVLFDTTMNAAKQLGLLSVPSSMHGGKFPGHTYVLLDKQGVIRQVIDDVTMSINNDKIVKEFTDLYK